MVDTMIRLFESTATDFSSNGLGNLPDASKCEVTEERNGIFELELVYPIDGKRYSDINFRSIIVAKPNPYSEPQPFRVYGMTKPMDGMVTINAEHISYDMSGYPVSPFTADTLQNAVADIENGAVVPSPFRITADFDVETLMNVEKPETMRSLLGGSGDSLINIYGGEFEFDKYRVILHRERGENKGVSIRYGKNLTDIQQEENCSNVYTAIYPYFYNDDYGLITLPEQTIPVKGTYDHVKVLPLDVTGDWENTHDWSKEFPSYDEIRDIAKQYMADNDIGVPTVSLNVSFELLSQTEEYKNIASLEKVMLCDTVNVEFPELNVSSTSQCIKTVYNVLTNKYVSIDLGESKSNLADAIASNNAAIKEELKNTPNKGFLEIALEHATKLITGNLGGYVVLQDSDKDGYPDEILIMDKPTIDGDDPAQKVWRWNKAGLGYSEKGYNGPYLLAITQEGEIDAQFIKVGTMLANRIQGGTLTMGGWDNTSGVFELRDSNGKLLIKMSKAGLEFMDEDGKTPITNIIDDTVTTEFINALKITAKDFTADMIEGKNIKGGKIEGTEIYGGSIEGTEISGGSIEGATIYATDTLKMLVHYNAMRTGYENVLRSTVEETGTPPLLSHTESIIIIGESTSVRFPNTAYFDGYVLVSGNNHVVTSPLGTTQISSLVDALNNTGGYIHINRPYGEAVGIYYNVSDTKLKKNIKKTKVVALTKVKQLEFIEYDWKKQDGHVELGISANQLEEIIPDAVDDIEQGEGSEYDTIKNINPHILINYGLKAVQEMSETIENQAKRIEDLEEKIDKVMAFINERM